MLKHSAFTQAYNATEDIPYLIIVASMSSVTNTGIGSGLVR
jgi:hypothetical protein